MTLFRMFTRAPQYDIILFIGFQIELNIKSLERKMKRRL